MFADVVQRPRWALFFFSVFSLSAAILFGGCGRSGLDDSRFADGGTSEGGSDAKSDGADGGKCGPASCPKGCCDASGTCRVGTDLQACGTLGQRCADCPTTGFDFCDVRSHACGKTVGACNPTTCPTGCCEGDLCLNGADPDECGTKGGACQHCASRGRGCDIRSRSCTAVLCGPSNCPGCCVGDVCVSGDQSTACGRSGQQCQNCAAQGIVCQPTPPSGGSCQGTPSCGPQNCPGCCIGNVCVGGTDTSACGLAGQLCQNCASRGEVCQSAGAGGFCSASRCDPSTCKGCCDGDTCRDGSDDFACGIGGGQCDRCSLSQQCQGGQCIGTQLCDPQTCPGCCIGDVCAPGDDDTACGLGGVFCENCAAQGEACAGKCTAVCGPQNCDGCCVGNVCVTGTADGSCGAGGQVCQDCTSFGDVCRSGLCVQQPSCANCAQLGGCCDPQLGCVGGFTGTRCGSNGAACVNCVAQGSTCDTNVTPRVCRNQQTTCPAPYASCPSNVTTAVLPQVHVCSALDLQNARAACSGGPNTPGCQSFFQFEQQANPACASCLGPFDVPLQDGSGIAACVAPFVSAQCNHTTGCALDCQTKSCSQCPQGAFNQCRNDVRQNQCGAFFQQSQCAAQALFGSASFCNPGNYQGNFGRWLQGVGGHYCGP